MGVVQTPPVEPPRVSLLASLAALGTYWLDPPDTIDGFTRPPLEIGGQPVLSPDDPPQRWWDQLKYLPEQACTGGWVADPCDRTTIRTNPAQPEVVNETPFEVGTGDKCSTFGWEEHDFVGRSVRGLLAVESKLIAKEFWKGTQAKASSWPNRYLADHTHTDVLSNGPVTPAQALDCLEQGLADCGNGQRGMIHCSPQLGSALSQLGNTLRTINGLILSYRDTVIVPDAGYDGSSPNGVARSSGSQWAYATLIPQVRRSPIQVIPGSYQEAIIRGTNDLEWRAERLAVVSFPHCCQLAIEVNLPLCLEGGAS